MPSQQTADEADHQARDQGPRVLPAQTRRKRRSVMPLPSAETDHRGPISVGDQRHEVDRVREVVDEREVVCASGSTMVTLPSHSIPTASLGAEQADDQALEDEGPADEPVGRAHEASSPRPRGGGRRSRAGSCSRPASARRPAAGPRSPAARSSRRWSRRGSRLASSRESLDVVDGRADRLGLALGARRLEIAAWIESRLSGSSGKTLKDGGSGLPCSSLDALAELVAEPVLAGSSAPAAWRRTRPSARAGSSRSSPARPSTSSFVASSPHEDLERELRRGLLVRLRAGV